MTVNLNSGGASTSRRNAGHAPHKRERGVEAPGNLFHLFAEKKQNEKERHGGSGRTKKKGTRQQREREYQKG